MQIKSDAEMGERTPLCHVLNLNSPEQNFGLELLAISHIDWQSRTLYPDIASVNDWNVNALAFSRAKD